MNGAELILRSALKAGIEVCFVNAGTTELPLVAAFDSVKGMRPVMGLFEGVCTGAADGYGRLKEKPALAILHLGPGLANGIANLHNAKRARTPLVNIVGQHATWHIPADAPLTMDIESLAGTVSSWTRTNRAPDALSADFAEAYFASMSGSIASLIVPSDHLWATTEDNPVQVNPPRWDVPDLEAIEAAAQCLDPNKRTALMVGGKALRDEGLLTAGRIAAITGCDLLTETFPGYVERGVGLPDVVRIPYFPEPAHALMSQYECIVKAHVREPVTFFGYPNIASRLIGKGQTQISLCSETQDVVNALKLLEDILTTTLRHKKERAHVSQRPRIELPRGALTAEKACQILAAVQPEYAIIVDEGITSAIPYYPLTAAALPHSVLTIAGGSIGYGMPCAVGAAIAFPERQVINLQADGSAMYTIQALWTQAREGLNVKTLICSNRGYNILRMELQRAGINDPGPKAMSVADIDQPSLDWISLSKGLGVPACSVSTADDLAFVLRGIFSEPGPYLVEMNL